MLFCEVSDRHYHLADPTTGIEFDVRRLHYERHELMGELAVSCGIAGAATVDGVLSIGSFNFSSPRARAERAKLLAERSRTNGKIDWHALLEETCQRVLIDERRGKPAVLLRTIQRTSTDRVLDVDGFTLLRDHPVIGFGDGGAAKSLLALYVAGQLANRGLRVLFADWELTGEEHRDRFERVFPDGMPDVLYVRCERPLVYEVERLARLRQQHDINYIVCDSISFAVDGPAEAHEVAARYFQATRQLGVGTLHLAHTNRSDRADEKPFGSTFWHNGARAAWFFKRTDEPSGNSNSILIGLFNKKANLSRLMPSVGFSITFGEDRTTFERADLADVAEMAVQLPLRERLCHVLRRGPQPLHRLAEELEAKVETVERVIRRYRNLFIRVSRDGVHHIALVERRRSA